MGRLLLELAEIECRMAALALGGGELGVGARSLARASYYLRLRASEVRAGTGESGPDERQPPAVAWPLARLS